MLRISPFSSLRYLRFECNFTHGVIEAPNFEFAGLKRISIRLLCQLQAWSIFRLVNPSGENLKVTRKRYFSPGQLIEKYILNTYRIFFTWISIGKALKRMGQMNVILVARAYITSKLESIHIPEICSESDRCWEKIIYLSHVDGRVGKPT